MPFLKEPMRFAECHTERKHYARGLCRKCYDVLPFRMDKIRANQKRWVQLNPDKLKHTWRLHQYGLTTNAFNSLVEKQAGSCAICRESFERPNVDHCHTSGVVRGLLCRTCNVGLGSFMDSPVLLRRAADYLEANHEAHKGATQLPDEHINLVTK